MTTLTWHEQRSMTRDERYLAKVDIGDSDTCWEWNACRNPLGYGMFAGGISQQALADEYGVSQATVSSIVRGVRQVLETAGFSSL